ncbi:MAG: family 43 glycosylhydrolase, partial [Catalinimonas sp.]
MRALLAGLLRFAVWAVPLAPAAAQNPISPPGVYVADPSARVWDDRLYLYGSTDEACADWCSWHYDVLYTDDLRTWRVTEDVFRTRGPNDQVLYNDVRLFAPDVARHDGKYYLYYCQPNADAEGVAVGTSPLGPFRGGTALDLGEHSEIDPAVFVDDDGTTYYLWGQFSLKMARLRPDHRGIDPSTLRTDIITEADHYFHEGAYLTKRNGVYYLIYADISREGKPTCLGYATSDAPFGPYTYRGVIVDNDGCNPNNWNNHGSIASFGERWYVFYHRSTHGCLTMRKACVEPITFRADGSIPEVEMTTQGAAPPLNARDTLAAARACLLQGHGRV